MVRVASGRLPLAEPKDTGPWSIFLPAPTPKTSDTKENITEFKMLLCQLPNSLFSLSMAVPQTASRGRKEGGGAGGPAWLVV